MGVHTYRELVTWQLADDFKREIARVVEASSAARQDFRYRGQVLESSRAVAKDIAEGFMRRSPLQFASFLDYAIGSLVEAEERLIDGIELGYFAAKDCQVALRLAKRCTGAILRLKESQLNYAKATRLRTRIPRT